MIPLSILFPFRSGWMPRGQKCLRWARASISSLLLARRSDQQPPSWSGNFQKCPTSFPTGWMVLFPICKLRLYESWLDIHPFMNRASTLEPLTWLLASIGPWEDGHWWPWPRIPCHLDFRLNQFHRMHQFFFAITTFWDRLVLTEQAFSQLVWKAPFKWGIANHLFTGHNRR